MRLRRDLPFRRIAVLLSGGAAYGAYEVGVLRALGRVGLRPAILAGVSVGAMNAVAWLAHGFDTGVLERTWRRLRPDDVGMRWGSLGLRVAGGVVGLLGLIELLLVVAGGIEPLMNAPWAAGDRSISTRLEIAAWLLLTLAGIGMMAAPSRLAEVAARLPWTADAAGRERAAAWALVAGIVLYAGVAAFGVPWPRRFHLMVLLIGAGAWVLGRFAGVRVYAGRMWLRLFSESEGRGVWRSRSRRRLIQSLVRQGDPRRLVAGDVRVIVSACDLESGRVSYLVNWDPDAGFRARIEEAFGDVVSLGSAEEVTEATVASSAVPVVFEPVPLRGREYMDGGVFSNQPLHAVTAAGADAVLLVLVSPSSGPGPTSRKPTLLEIASRMPELANLRNLNAELRSLPAGFSREGAPATVCAVEPEKPLPGWMYSIDPVRAAELIALGERDADRALRASGWVEEGDADAGSRAAARTGVGPREA